MLTYSSFWLPQTDKCCLLNYRKNITVQNVLYYSARGVVDPYRGEAWRAEARTRRVENRGGVPDRRPGVFEHSVSFLRHLNSVWGLQHLSTLSMDKIQMAKWPWRTTFFYKTSCLEKNTQIQTVQSGASQQEGAGSQVWSTGSVIRGSGSQTRGVRSEIRWDPPP